MKAACEGDLNCGGGGGGGGGLGTLEQAVLLKAAGRQGEQGGSVLELQGGAIIMDSSFKVGQ